MTFRRAVATALMLLVATAALAGARREAIVHVSAGASLQRAVDAAPPGAVLVLGPGTHQGPLTIERRITLRGEPRAVISAGRKKAAVAIHAAGTALRGVEIRGGETGVYVRDVEGVVLEDLLIRRSEMQGIDIADAAATVRAVTVRDLVHPMAQGIEVRNSEHRGVISVLDSRVEGGQEGIVSHVSRVRFENNTVVGTRMHAISITEMSRGIAAGNRVMEAAGAGLYCGDMSRCEFRSNEVQRVASAGAVRSLRGWGLLVHYHSSAHSDGDRLAGAAGPLAVFESSHMRDSSPLRLGDAWSGIAPVLPVTLISLLVLVALAYPLRRFIRPPAVEKVLPWMPAVLVAALLVQGFHMIEHVLQVYRVYFDGVPSRGGLAGQVVENEWVHFTYNMAVLVFLIFIAASRRKGWGAHAARTGDGFLGAAILLQGYHLVEHTFKVVQHITTGAKVNPGIAGNAIDLVWFHFGINLAVYAGFAIAAFAYLRVRGRSAPAGAPAVASAG